MRRLTALIPFLWCTLAIVCITRSANAQAGGAYNLEWNTLSGGGQTFATGGAYSLGGSAGQPDAGSLAGGSYVLSGGFWGGSPVPTTGVDTSEDPRPRVFAARVAGANPFRQSTAVQFDLPGSSRVAVTMFSVDGRMVRRLIDGQREAGRHTAFWDGTASDGRAVQPGMYFALVQAGPAMTTLRIVRVQ